MNINRKKDLHRRYLTRELSSEELKEFFAMLEDGEAGDIADFDEVADQFPTDLVPSENIARKILRKERLDRFPRLLIRRGIAAAISTLIFFAGYQGYREYTFIQETKTFAIVRVPLGKMTEIILEDGTKVTLTSGSIFKYPKAFTKAERRVYLLEGQGFFNVAHNKQKPFRVNSGKLSTTALGTSFIIKHYKNYGYEKVSLYTGSVRVDRNGVVAAPVILQPGQEYNYHNERLGQVSGFDNSKDPIGLGSLDFKRVAFPETMYGLSTYYGVKILFNEVDFKDLKVSGNFNSNSIDEILRSLTFIYPFTIKKIDSSTYNLKRIEKRRPN